MFYNSILMTCQSIFYPYQICMIFKKEKQWMNSLIIAYTLLKTLILILKNLELMKRKKKAKVTKAKTKSTKMQKRMMLFRQMQSLFQEKHLQEKMPQDQTSEPTKHLNFRQLLHLRSLAPIMIMIS